MLFLREIQFSLQQGCTLNFIIDFLKKLNFLIHCYMRNVTWIRCGKAFDGCFFFLPPGKRASCFVPGGLLCQDLGMMSKMFSLRVNLRRKKLILRSVIQLITQGQAEHKGQVKRTDCCAGRANSLFGCIQSGASVQETTPGYWWML